MNKLEPAYRRTQRELRREFEAFTQSHCATCPTPCCRKPSRITRQDILLAQNTGWRSKVKFVEPDEDIFELREAEGEEGQVPPDCDYLTPGGCSFPQDMRPFGCVTYVCRYMHADMNKQTLTKIKRLSKLLEDQWRVLARGLK